MIRTKYKVLVPLVEYYEKEEEDIKTMQELLYKGAKISQTTRN